MRALLRKTMYFLWRLRATFYLDFPFPCRLPFGSWYLAYGDGMGFMFFFHRPYEENEWRFMQNFLKPGMTFFDVGANQGFYTLLAAKKVQKEGMVFSFEPVPSQMKKLRKNIKINGFGNVKIEGLALGSESGFAALHISLNGDEAMSSLREPYMDASSKREAIQVPVLTLDEYVLKNKIQSVDFIKVDVEGGELGVLQRAINIIKNYRPIFMCEVQDIRTQQWGYSSKEICRFLESYSYKWFQALQNGLIGRFQVSKAKDEKGQNLIAIPEEKVSLVSSFLEKQNNEQ